MSKYIKIGHASLGEDGLVSGGKPGDQTGKEVYIAENYDITKRGYHILLRPTTAELAEKSALACEAGCNNPHIGYSQFGTYDRSTLYTAAKKVGFNLSKDVLVTDCNADCSAFMYVCALAGGAKIDCGSWGPTTSSMKAAFTISDSAYYKAYEAEKDPIYFESSDYLRRGDILVGVGIHTIMVLSNGSKIPTSTIETLDNFFAITIAADIKNITETGASASIKITKIENGKEELLSNINQINKYEWSYELCSLSSSNVKPTFNKLNVSSSSSEINLKNLKSNSSYMIKIIAKEVDSDATFNSPNIIFTTKQESVINTSETIDFKGSSLGLKHFIKIDDVFKPAILYNTREV